MNDELWRRITAGDYAGSYGPPSLEDVLAQAERDGYTVFGVLPRGKGTDGIFYYDVIVRKNKA